MFVIIILHFCHHPLSWCSFPILIIVILDSINIILLLETRILFLPNCTRMVGVARTRKQRVRQKVWTWTKTLSLNIRNLVTINALFGRLGENKCFLGVKNSVSLARYALLHDGIYCILYWIKLANLQYAQKRRICHEYSKYVPGKNYLAIFASGESLPTSATLPCTRSYLVWINRFKNDLLPVCWLSPHKCPPRHFDQLMF